VTVIQANAITQDLFDPYGQLLDIPRSSGRYDYAANLFSNRELASANLLLVQIEPSHSPIDIVAFERHPHSSQTFVPLEVSKYLVIVCPQAPSGEPDYFETAAFIVPGNAGINYNPGVWHHPLTVLGSLGSFAALVWEDGGSSDTEWIRMPKNCHLQVDI